MLESAFRDARLMRRLRASLLGPAFDELSEHLVLRGHPIVTIRQYIQGVAHFDTWLIRSRRTIASLDDGVLDDFLRHLPSCRCPRPCSKTVGHLRPAIRHLLDVLRGTGRVRPSAARRDTPAAALARAFVTHLREHGAAPETCTAWGRYASEFLTEVFGSRAVVHSQIDKRKLDAFFVARSGRWTTLSMKHAASGLRTFFRYLLSMGCTDRSLVHAVPRFATWRLGSLPRVLSATQIAKVFASFDRSTPIGLRGYAITMCLAGLGLRSCEIAALTLDSVDWRAGTIIVAATKTRRADVLPLPADIARAIVAYLRRGRPATPSRQLFVKHQAPRCAPFTTSLVRRTLRTACARAGFPSRTVSPHMFRHTVATRMLRAGATMKEVADILRHSSLNTTAIYAKVNIEDLRDVAAPWPQRTS
jgi:integrase/recombinase XerD